GATAAPWATGGAARAPSHSAVRSSRSRVRIAERQPTENTKAGKERPCRPSYLVSERATGFEPVTSSLGSWHSTPELRPQAFQHQATSHCKTRDYPLPARNVQGH